MSRSANTTHRSPRRVVQLAAVLALAAAACGNSLGDNDAAPATAAPASTTTASTTPTTATDADSSASAGTDWCPSEDEVAEVVGHVVTQAATGGGMASSDQLTYSYGGCSYSDTDTDSDTDYSITRATLQTDEDGSAFDLLDQDAQAAAADQGFTPVEDLGDDAYLDGQSLVYRTGDTMVFLEVEAEGDDDAADQRDTLAEDLAMIDLSDDETLCSTPAAAVEDAFGPVSDTSISSGATAINDVSIDFTSCTFATDGGTEVKVRVADAGSWDDWVAAMQSSGFSASYEALLIGEYAAFDTGEVLIVDDSEEPLRIETWTPEISDEDATAIRVALAELVLAG